MDVNIVFGLVIIVQLIYIIATEFANKKERRQLIKAILAKNLTELTQNDIIEDRQEQEPVKPTDEVLSEDADDDTFKKFIENTNG